MKSYFFEFLRQPIYLFIFYIPLIVFEANMSNAEELILQEMEIDSSTKFDDKRSEFPTNPFEIVEMIRRVNSLNDATNPADAIDDALKSFNDIDQKEEI